MHNETTHLSNRLSGALAVLIAGMSRPRLGIADLFPSPTRRQHGRYQVSAEAKIIASRLVVARGLEPAQHHPGKRARRRHRHTV